MLCNGYEKVLDLSHGDLVELNDARGTTVRVTKGTIWITQEHDTQDIVLRAGDVWTVEREGLTLIEAHGETLVCVVGAAAGIARLGSRYAGLADRLYNWFRSAGIASRKERAVPYY